MCVGRVILFLLLLRNWVSENISELQEHQEHYLLIQICFLLIPDLQEQHIDTIPNNKRYETDEDCHNELQSLFKEKFIVSLHVQIEPIL